MFGSQVINDLKFFIRAQPVIRNIYVFAIQVEDWIFDLRHHVKTRDTRSDRKALLGDRRKGFEYLPTRAERARITLRLLPDINYEEYTFIDIGSGKGRLLLIAAELPFAEVLGVEMRSELHQQAITNIRNCRNLVKKSPIIKSLNINALDFIFPRRNLVLFLANPFGYEITQQFFNHLDFSLQQTPRDVIVIMLVPDFAYVAEAATYLRTLHSELHCRIYRSYFPEKLV